MSKLRPPSAKRIFGSEGPDHFKAKVRLARWLHQAAITSEQAQPAYEVVIEYPFTEFGGGLESWNDSGFGRKPTTRQLRANETPAFYICDIAILEAGKVTTVVEVVDTHITPFWKVRWLRKHGIAVYEARAAKVLAVKKRPPSFDDIVMEVDL